MVTYIIRCRVSGGPTGTRESVVHHNGITTRFATKARAEAEAARYRKEMRAYSCARFHYWVDTDDCTLGPNA